MDNNYFFLSPIDSPIVPGFPTGGDCDGSARKQYGRPTTVFENQNKISCFGKLLKRVRFILRFHVRSLPPPESDAGNDATRRAYCCALF